MIIRDIQPYIDSLAQQYPVVTVTGPRQSGKTTLCGMAFPDKPIVSLEAPDTRMYATQDPRGFLADYTEGAVFDEIQKAPDLLSYLQGEVDRDDRPGRFILTGSENFTLSSSISQSLSGRTALATLLPLSAAEVSRFSTHPESLFSRMFTGSYPAILDRNHDPQDWLSTYLATYLERDVRQILNIGNLNAFQSFVRLLAGNAGQILSMSRIGADSGVSQPTAKSWLSVLETGYIVYRLNPYHSNLRKRLTKRPKLYFYDTGLLCYLIGIRKPEQIKYHPLRGAIFENWIIGEIVRWLKNSGEHYNLFFYRDSSGLEADLILDLGTRLVVCEIKSAMTIAPDFFRGLRTVANIVGNDPTRTDSVQSILIYGGDDSQSRTAAYVVPWHKLAAPGLPTLMKDII